jgi:hypothetical protein
MKALFWYVLSRSSENRWKKMVEPNFKFWPCDHAYDFVRVPLMLFLLDYIMFAVNRSIKTSHFLYRYSFWKTQLVNFIYSYFLGTHFWYPILCTYFVHIYNKCFFFRAGGVPRSAYEAAVFSHAAAGLLRVGGRPGHHQLRHRQPGRSGSMDQGRADPW